MLSPACVYAPLGSAVSLCGNMHWSALRVVRNHAKQCLVHFPSAQVGCKHSIKRKRARGHDANAECVCTATAGAKFYAWLASWNWDLSVLADPSGERPQATCIARYQANKAANGGAPRMDACACDAIVTDCHVNAVSSGSGAPENSAPFNVYNSAGLYDPPADHTQRKEWWNAASSDFAWRHECVLSNGLASALAVC